MFMICGEALYDVFVDPLKADVRLKVDLTAKPGGSPFNVAIGLARLGCPVSLATQIADDVLGRHLEARLRAEGVNCDFIRRTAKATPLAMVQLDSAGAPSYRFYGLHDLLFYPEISAVKPRWRDIVGIHVGSIPIVSPSSSGPLLELLAAAPPKVVISFDPNIRLSIEPSADRWREAVDRFRRHAHLIKVSEEDLANLYGPQADPEAIARSWLQGECVLVTVTRGAAGARYYSRHATLSVEAIPVTIADTVGAGDSFQAATLAWLLENHHASPAGIRALSAAEIIAMGQFAAQAAAATCRQRGPEFPYRKTIRPPV